MQGIIEKDAPLYHRFNEEILLHAFDYRSSSQMMGHISNEEKLLYQKLYEIQAGRKSKESVKERLKGVFK